MPVFSMRQAPSLRWMARTAEPCGARAPRPEDAAALNPAQHPREIGLRAPRCGIDLPDGYALRLEARTHATPHSHAGCPLEASVLRQWCVLNLQGDCPEQAQPTPPAYLQKHV